MHGLYSGTLSSVSVCKASFEPVPFSSLLIRKISFGPACDRPTGLIEGTWVRSIKILRPELEVGRAQDHKVLYHCSIFLPTMN